MITGKIALQFALALFAAWFVWLWFRRDHGNIATAKPDVERTAIGLVTNFFDTLGIGSFAPTTSIFKFRRLVADENIPGTLNVGHTPPTMVQALIFIGAVSVELPTLIGMIAASACGAWVGSGLVSRMPRRAIQIGMGVALLVAATLFSANNLQLMPGGGEALGLHGGALVFAIVASFILGTLMMVGIGLYAPCMILVSLLGMSPLAAFPIMMGSCAFLMPVGSVGFLRTGRYDFRAALGLALGGIPGVLIAAFIVKSMPLEWLRWLVVIVVVYASLLMLNAARKP
jgi:uncharacterized membrane protein YfcA